ncbi:hypothetical protein QNH10_13965 [Sporosarcina thermotolerans]|uniref:hypothetical protein n=1 Tax=Sporosarcina thermotolerans TaxID=633404 RepID=UPI0024BBF4D3|nr:hypothetical protein [Sporosarcina thermotolerans]WHT47307.1 hypothetical protein QNH10_13965 [Sporosarcina thermotolerans]
MENVKWINGSHKEDNRIFDSEFEVKEWTEALYPDFVAYLSNKNNVGYATPDEKVINYLASLFLNGLIITIYKSMSVQKKQK